MGFIPTSTTHVDSTVSCRISHDAVKLHEHEELSLDSDTTCYK